MILPQHPLLLCLSSLALCLCGGASWPSLAPCNVWWSGLERGEGIAGPRKVNGFHFGLIVHFPHSRAVCVDGSVLGEGSALGSQGMDWKHSQMRGESCFDLVLLFVSSQAAVAALALGTALSQQGRLCPPSAPAPGPSWQGCSGACLDKSRQI